MIINHNMNAMNAHRQMLGNTTRAAGSMEKLSSGLRINKAGDDASGLGISEKMRGQIRGLDQAGRNAQDGISLIQTAEGALTETHSILQRMRELSVQSTNGTNTGEDRKAMQAEVTQLKGEIDRIGDTTEFNTIKLLDGGIQSAGASVGTNSTMGAQVGKLIGAQVGSSANLFNALDPATVALSFTSEDIEIDGTKINVEWQNLTPADRAVLTSGVGTASSIASQTAAKDLIVKTINNAIDKSGTGIAHVSAYVNSASCFVLQSGTQGVKSTIKTGFDSTKTGIANAILGPSSAIAAGTIGTNKYNGTSITTGDKLNFNINGISLQASFTSDITGGATTDMSNVAASIQTAVNAAISNYNNTISFAKSSNDPGWIEQIKINVTDDGRFEAVSPTAAINFTELPGKTTVSDLGLNSAQTSAGGNGGMTLQIGANNKQSLTFGINDMRSASLGVSAVDVSTQGGAANAITTVDTAIRKVSEQRANIGAYQNRLEHTISNLGTASENTQAAESRIRDVDMAKEMVTFSKNNILSQAAQAMLAQANQQPQGVLQLLR